MPFTLSHAVLAPVIARVSQNTLPLAALAIGCMLPDLYRLFVTDAGHLSHRWSGQLYPNLVIGLGFCGLWYGVYRPMLYPLINLSDPIQIQDLSAGLRFVIAVVLALLIGNATHIVWDGFTHVDFRTLVLHDFLSQRIALFGLNYPLHFALQILSSVLTLPLLVYWILRYCAKHRCEAYISKSTKWVIWGILALSVLFACYYTHQYFYQFPLNTLKQQPYYFIGRGFNEFSQMFLITSAITLSIVGIVQQFFRVK